MTLAQLTQVGLLLPTVPYQYPAAYAEFTPPT